MRLSLVLPAIATCATMAAGAPAAAESVLDLQGQGVGLAMSVRASQPDRPQVESEARLTAGDGPLQTHVQLGLGVGSAPAPGALASGWWNSGAADVGAVWRPSGAAELHLGARSATRTEFDPAGPLFLDAAGRVGEERTSAASAAAVLKPLEPLRLTVGAEVETTRSRVATLSGSAPASVEAMESDARRLTARLALTPVSGLALEGGGRVQATALAAPGARVETAPAVDPSVALRLQPWSGGGVKLSLERATDALATDQFVGSLADSGEGALLPAGQEWRYGASLSQKAGAVDFTASVLTASLTRYAYVGPRDGQGWRAAPGAGDRRQVSAALEAPLAGLGFTLEAKATWRASDVQDPLTGGFGRLSGERPYDAALTLSREAGPGLRWGVTAQAGGPQRLDQQSAISTFSATAGVGGFLQYRARPVTLQLRLDNLIGGERDQRDVYYLGGRELNVVERSTSSRIVDRGVHLSLIRPL